MKSITSFSLLLLVAFLPGFQCKKESTTECFKGRLEVKGQCMNYTIKVLEGRIDPSMVEAVWTNPATGIRYENVFRLKSICEFPADIQEGQEFYFTLNASPKLDCITCAAAYPTPSKSLAIAASKTPCN